jgi:hypothetical protein
MIWSPRNAASDHSNAPERHRLHAHHLRFPVMIDPLTKAKRFHALSEENIRLAETVSNASKRNHYRKLAEHYLLLAEAELKAATSTGARSGVDH